MRGSPLIRSIFLVIALAAIGGFFLRMTAAKSPAVPAHTAESSPDPATRTLSTPYRLLLSAPAEEIQIGTGITSPTSAASSPLSGTLNLDPSSPQISLLVRWTTPPGENETRFAKLILEIPGQPTFTHVFDAAGDIDDFLELPAFTAP